MASTLYEGQEKTMHIPIRRKPPVRLQELASSANQRVQKPCRLEDAMEQARQMQMQGGRQAAPGQAASSHGNTQGLQMQGNPVAARRASIPTLSGASLKKGQKVSLVPKGQALPDVEACLYWDVKHPACDIDVSAFLLGGNGKVVGDEWFVFYGQEKSPDGSVVHLGDSQGGNGETIQIHWGRRNQNVKKIVFTLTINEALERKLNFGMVSGAVIQIRDKQTGKGLLHFALEECYSNVISMVIGELYERNGEWKFSAVGNGVERDLAGLCEFYGVCVAG